MQPRRQAGGPWIALTGLLVLTAGCSSKSDGGLLTDQAAQALAEQLIREMETAARPDELQMFESFRLLVESYDFAQPVDPASLPPPEAGLPRAIIEPEDEAHLYMAIGVFALLQGSQNGALWCSLQAVRLKPACADYLSQAGAFLSLLGRHDPARAFLHKAKHLEPGTVQHRMSLAVSLAETGEKTAAAAELETAMATETDHRLLGDMLLGVYLVDLPAGRALREELHMRCSADLEFVRDITSSEQLRSFTEAMSAEISDITDNLILLFQRMPQDLPDGLMEGLQAAQEDYTTRFTQGYETPLDAAVAEVQADIDAEIESSARTLANCNAATNYECTCAYVHCAGHMNTLRSQTVPATFTALRAFLPGSLRLLRGQELAMVGEIVRRQPELSPGTLDWALRIAYAELHLQCKALSLDYASALAPHLTHLDTTSLYCTYAQGCRDAEEEAKKEAARRALEAEQEAEAMALEILASLSEWQLLEPLKFEVCLVVGCLAVDGPQITLKTAGPLAVSVTVDTDAIAIGTRIHLGLSDPTGNGIGGEVSIGGTVGAQGTSLSAEASIGAAGGTVGKTTTLFHRTFTWRQR
jgi:hypothetical protein